MKLKNNFLSIVAALSMAATIFSSVALASDDFTLNITSPTVAAGETAEVTVSLTGNPGLISLSFYTDFDKSFTVGEVSTAGCALLDSNSTINASVEQNKYYYLFDWSDNMGMTAHSQNGTLITMKVNVPAETAPGDYPITVRFKDIWDIEYTDLEPTVTSAKITVKGTEPEMPTAGTVIVDDLDGSKVVYTNSVEANTLNENTKFTVEFKKGDVVKSKSIKRTFGQIINGVIGEGAGVTGKVHFGVKIVDPSVDEADYGCFTVKPE